MALLCSCVLVFLWGGGRPRFGIHTALTICGVDCVRTIEYVSPSKLFCTTGAGRGAGSVIVTTRSGGAGVCTVKFTYESEEDVALTNTLVKEFHVWVEDHKDYWASHKDMTATDDTFTALFNATRSARLAMAGGGGGGASGSDANQHHAQAGMGASEMDMIGAITGVMPLNAAESAAPGSGGAGGGAESDPMGIKPLRALSPQALPSAAKFDAGLFLNEAHGQTEFEELKAGIPHLHELIEIRGEAQNKWMKHNFDDFILCQKALDDLRGAIIKSEKAADGPITTRFDSIINEASHYAHDEFSPLLDRKDRSDSIRNVLNVLHRHKFLFSLPRNMQANIRAENLEVAIQDYKRMKSLFGDSEIGVFNQVVAEVERIMGELRATLFKRLQRPAALDEQERLIRYLIELDAEEDPVWYCLSHIRDWLINMMTRALDELHQAQREEYDRRNQMQREWDQHRQVGRVDGGQSSQSGSSSNKTKKSGKAKGKGAPTATTSPSQEQFALRASLPASSPATVIHFVRQVCELISSNVPQMWSLGQLAVAGRVKRQQPQSTSTSGRTSASAAGTTSSSGGSTYHGKGDLADVIGQVMQTFSAFLRLVLAPLALTLAPTSDASSVPASATSSGLPQSSLLETLLRASNTKAPSRPDAELQSILAAAGVDAMHIHPSESIHNSMLFLVDPAELAEATIEIARCVMTVVVSGNSPQLSSVSAALTMLHDLRVWSIASISHHVSVEIEALGSQEVWQIRRSPGSKYPTTTGLPRAFETMIVSALNLFAAVVEPSGLGVRVPSGGVGPALSLTSSLKTLPGTNQETARQTVILAIAEKAILELLQRFGTLLQTLAFMSEREAAARSGRSRPVKLQTGQVALVGHFVLRPLSSSLTHRSDAKPVTAGTGDAATATDGSTPADQTLVQHAVDDTIDSDTEYDDETPMASRWGNSRTTGAANAENRGRASLTASRSSLLSSFETDPNRPQTERRLILSLANCLFTREVLVHRCATHWSLVLQRRNVRPASPDLAQVVDTVKHHLSDVDARVFGAYMDLKGETTKSLIRAAADLNDRVLLLAPFNSVTKNIKSTAPSAEASQKSSSKKSSATVPTGGLGDSNATVPSDVREYAKELLYLLVSLHADIFSLAPSFLSRVLGAASETILDEFDRLLHKPLEAAGASGISRESAMQAWLEIRLLDRALGRFYNKKGKAVRDGLFAAFDRYFATLHAKTAPVAGKTSSSRPQTLMHAGSSNPDDGAADDGGIQARLDVVLKVIEKQMALQIECFH
ncbi:hypothetical protein CAOG_01910 [Capsaspora owczarzaki ATCC 30864]|uniref:hypothetical protein n=1 Tax=Capsaspora owczarzaki (strain ATCC 30864) TaxID=595528 RepID=UPI0001FE5E18|nr:hypothetical protein CAOG_01910 [Capsaspora owczarzaki ATCC 30864]|eukprot:XP_004364778.1 hypothetical protein CAOG_01910 [Capsaspora owczarzaki ATCC 30864]